MTKQDKFHSCYVKFDIQSRFSLFCYLFR